MSVSPISNPTGFRRSLVLIAGLAVCGSLRTTPAAEPERPLPETVRFNRDIRPILSDNCFYCHGPDKNRREAELRLDTEAGLLGGEARKGVVRPGEPQAGELMKRVASADPDLKMPPPDSGKNLSERDLAMLRKWIEQGAKFEGHWAFRPVASIEKTPSETRVSSLSNSIDTLVGNARKANGLSKGKPADARTLLRRLHFDLTGLPPEPVEVEAFLTDSSPSAYEKKVDALLASPHFGERMAMWWLDLVRYADSVGYHGDQDVSVSPFRQYVIESFNAGKPFDVFTREQIAGDLADQPTLQQRIASGYNRLGMMSAEGGVQDREYLAKYIAERVRNVSGTWLGVTMGCAECHDHKFDPFTTRDFYRMEAFFADIKERGLYSGANSDGNWGPSVRVPTPEQQEKLNEFDRRIAETKTILNTATPELAEAQSRWEAALPRWTNLAPAEIVTDSGSAAKILEDLSVLVSGSVPVTDEYRLKFASLPAGVTAIRLEVLPDDSLPNKGPGRAGNGNFVLTEIVAERSNAEGGKSPVKFSNAFATFEQTGAVGKNPYGKWAVAAAIDGDEKGPGWGWAIMEKAGSAQSAIFLVDPAAKKQEAADWSIVLKQKHDNAGHTIGRFRISYATGSFEPGASPIVPAAIEAILAIEPGKRTGPQQDELAAYFRSFAPQLKATRDHLAEIEKARAELDKTVPRTLVTESVMPRMVRVLPRGNWMDESGEPVKPGFPSALKVSGFESADDRKLDRRDLAAWIVSKDHPLTARVFVNRIWKLLFGEAISRKVDDLGAQGSPPTHPELLDELAARFVESGWNVKGLIKSILMSETYRQSSQATQEVIEADPYNFWLARQGRFRLDAELVRDNALAISQLLVGRIGGPSVKPYQPPGYWAYLNFPTREWQADKGDSLYRRGLYTHWQRQYLHPSLLAFDAPSREECTADRARSNTPLQSLVLLNDPTYVEAARAFAELTIRNGGTTAADRIDFAFRRAVSRPARTQEIKILERLLETARAEYAAKPEMATALGKVGERAMPADIDASTLAAWTAVTRAILNLHETITRY
ncbi:DUF1553 domain-containing protein [bacterium]|nr:DUF1553 domain-containing protein [bacterium]